jgi:anti-anti-sigma regulatory factor
VQHEELTHVHTTLLERGMWHGMLTGVRSDGTTFPAQLTAFVIKNSEGTIQSLPAIIRDMTEQQRAEAAQAELREQVITTQQSLIRQLSTPLLPITSNVIALPLIGTIGSERAQQILETLLEGIAHHQSDIAILDITGVTVVDTQVAQAILQAARAVRLLGAQVVLTGIQPAIAQVLVQLGADLRGVRTFSTLQGGIAYAMGRRVGRRAS